MQTYRRMGFLVVLLAAVVLAAGCGRPQTPAPGPEPRTQQQQGSQQMSLQAAQAARIAETRQGVRSAYAVEAGPSTILIGLFLEPNVQGSAAQELEKSLAEEIPKQLTGVDRAVVTANPDLAERVREIGRGVAGGRPIAEFKDETQQLIDRISPKTGTDGTR